MDSEELERQAKRAIAAAGDMASRGVEWVKNFSEAHSQISEAEPIRDGNRRIYGVTKIAQQSTGFRAFNAFRLMISPLIIRIIWLIGAYIVYPIAMISILGSMSQSRYVTAGDMWKTVGISILVLIVFRLFLESLMAIFRIHESSTKTTELMERLVKLKEGRESESQEAGE
ncbi:MAG: hypothetical protein IKQ17_05070 [Kiritimatiellae bacterium]|nr:hypothetical protein [Kiritimatiellia bacterium]